MTPEIFHHIILNAVLFFLTGVRYFWGNPANMLRLGLFLTLGWVIIGDMDLYYGWPITLPAIEFSDRGLVTKILLIATYAVDLGRDYMTMRFRHRLDDLSALVSEDRGK